MRSRFASDSPATWKDTRELAVIRVPSQEEERARHTSRQREQLVHHRQKLEAQGRSLLVNHGLPTASHWWKNQTWSRLQKVLPTWIIPHLELYRPILLELERQIAGLTVQLVSSAPKEIPDGIGKLTVVSASREICDWHRFKNRRTISSYTGLCPGEHSSGNKRVPGSVTKRGNRRLRALLVECAWRMVRFQPHYPPLKQRLGVLSKGARATGAQRKKAIVSVARQAGRRSLASAHRPRERGATRIQSMITNVRPPRASLGSGGTVPTI
jgi:transposase